MNAIVIDKATKIFRIPASPPARQRPLLHTLLPTKTSLTALVDVSITIKKGEWFGIIGHNGSGKSTLLKLIAGLYQPSRGRVQVNGRVVPLLGLGAGFHPDLSAKDNVTLNGLLLGLSRQQIQQRYDSIVQFADLDRFMAMPLRHFSSGMRLRLAFAIAVHVEADIILLDEVLTVGDETFRKRCLTTLEDRRATGTTVVLVSHSLPQLKTLCDRAALLENGRVIITGPAEAVFSKYREHNSYSVAAKTSKR